MDETLRQLGELVLGSVPTIILFILLYLAYRVLVHRPLSRVLAERRERTQGAMGRAQAAIAAVEGKTSEYERRLRAARAEIFHAQEARLKQMQEVRAQALAEARRVAEARVETARREIEASAATAQQGLSAKADMLANEIIRVVLQGKGAAAPATEGAR